MISQKTRRPYLTFVKIALGLLLLYLAFQRVDWPILLNVLRSVSGFWLILAILCVLLSLVFKVLRWDLLLSNYKQRLPPMLLISAFILGQAANILLVIRGGEVVRVATAHQPGKDDWVEITATIAIEKYLDLVLLVLLMLFSVNNLPPLATQNLGNFRFILIIFTAILFLLVMGGPIFWKKIVPLINQKNLFTRIFAKIEKFIQASLWLKNPRRLIPTLVITLIIWIVMAITNLLVFRSLSIDLSWNAAILVLILIYLGVLPALMPGNVGPFTYFAQLALLPFAVENELAVAYAIILYVIVTLPPLLLAGVMLLFPQTSKLRESI